MVFFRNLKGIFGENKMLLSIKIWFELFLKYTAINNSITQNSTMEAQINDIQVKTPLLKRIFDIIFSVIIIVMLSPILLASTIAIIFEGLCIRKNNGPIFYTETRMSEGRPFTLRKFRIFKTSAYEPIRARGEIVETKPLERDPQNLTHVGNMLKRFYLDEAPQLFSVFIGDMSLVGPRPWNPVDYKREIEEGEFRKKVIRAGLTGPVQIHKLDAKAYGGEHKLDHDYIIFVKNNNGARVVLHDLMLLFQSFWFMVHGQGL